MVDQYYVVYDIFLHSRLYYITAGVEEVHRDLVQHTDQLIPSLEIGFGRFQGNEWTPLSPPIALQK